MTSKPTLTIYMCLIILANLIYTGQANANSGSDYFLKMGIAFYSVPKYDSAIIYCTEAASLAQQENNYATEANANNRLAYIYYETERESDALTSVKTTEDLFSRGLLKDSLLFTQCLDIKGDIFYYQNDAYRCYESWLKGFTIRKRIYGESSPNLAFDYRNLCRYFNLKVEKDSAYIYGIKSLQLLDKSGNNFSQVEKSLIYNDFAYATKIYQGRKWKDDRFLLDPSAYELYDKAIYYARVAFHKPSLLLALLYHNFGNLHNDYCLYYSRADTNKMWQQYRIANDYYSKALTIYKSYLPDKSEKIGTTYWVLAFMNGYEKIERVDLALNDCNKALQCLFADYNSNSYMDEPKSIKCSNKTNAISVIKQLLWSLRLKYSQTNDLKFLEAELNWHRVQADLWSGIMNDIGGRTPSEILNIYTDIDYQLAIADCYELYGKTGNEKYKTDILYYSEVGRNSVLRKNLLLYSAQNPGKALEQVLYNPIEIERKLSSGEIIIDYNFIPTYNGATSIFVYAITKDTVILQYLDIRVAELEKNIHEYRDGISAGSFETTRFYGIKFFDVLLKPILSQYKNKFQCIDIIPDGAISLIPFEELITDTTNQNRDFRNLHYALYDYTFTYDLSLTTKFWNYGSRNYSGKILGFAPVSFASGLSELPFSQRNLASIKTMFEGDYFLKGEATKNAFLKCNSNYSVIQVSSHSIANSIHPDLSGIYFSPVNAQNDMLTYKEIYDLKFQPQLAILTSCETSMGKNIKEEGILNLSRAFLNEGAEAVISTLWKTDDKATSDLLTLFYRFLGENASTTTALRKAKIVFLQTAKSSDEANPYYWSGIVLTGKDSYLKLKDQGINSVWYYLFGAAFFISVVLFIRSKTKVRLK